MYTLPEPLPTLFFRLGEVQALFLDEIEVPESSTLDELSVFELWLRRLLVEDFHLDLCRIPLDLEAQGLINNFVLMDGGRAHRRLHYLLRTLSYPTLTPDNKWLGENCLDVTIERTLLKIQPTVG